MIHMLLSFACLFACLFVCLFVCLLFLEQLFKLILTNFNFDFDYVLGNSGRIVL